jgi:hypothetical protein
VAAGRQRREIDIEDQHRLLQILPGCLAVAAKDLAQGGLHGRHIGLRRRIQRGRNHRLIGTPGQAKRLPQGWVNPNRRPGLRDSFGSGEQRDQEHLQFLDRRVFQRFLLDLHLGLQRGKKAGAA